MVCVIWNERDLTQQANAYTDMLSMMAIVVTLLWAWGLRYLC